MYVVQIAIISSDPSLHAQVSALVASGSDRLAGTLGEERAARRKHCHLTAPGWSPLCAGSPG